MLNDEIEGVKRRQGGAGAAGGGGGKLGVLVVGLVVGLIGGALLMVLTPLGARLHPAPEARERVVEVPGETPEPEVRVVEKIVEKRVEVPVPAEPPAMPTRPVSYDPNIEISELFNGIQIRSELVSEEGGIASIEREQGGAFEAKFELRLTVPSATRELNDLAASNEHFPKLLTEMPSLLEGSEVSPYFFHLYDLKQRQVQSSLTRLQNALSRHNFYDCETALELTHDASGRRMFYLQGEMDVVSDGSDGDRMPQMSPEIYESPHYQALTSYGWPKKTRQPNPLLKVTEAKLEKYKERYKVVGLTRRENQFLESQIEYLPRVIQDLKSRSFLLAEADPFIVIPLSMRDYKGKDPFIPGVGDYAVVIHEDKLYPAIVGEYGPRTKVGEASLRIAKQINPRANPRWRPVSDLTVGYLIFPGTAERPFSQPNLKRWHERCQALLDEIGGIGEGYVLHEWDDPFNPEPEEVPTTEEGEVATDGESGDGEASAADGGEASGE